MSELKNEKLNDEALKEVANGEANKVFIPFEATSAVGGIGAIKEVLKDDKKSKKE